MTLCKIVRAAFSCCALCQNLDVCRLDFVRNRPFCTSSTDDTRSMLFPSHLRGDIVLSKSDDANLFSRSFQSVSCIRVWIHKEQDGSSEFNAVILAFRD